MIRWLACVLLILQIPAVGQAQGVLSFMRGQQQRHYESVPHQVLAFYYTWYGRPEREGHWVHWGRVDEANHNASDSTHFPMLGAYDSQDPSTIDKHLDMAIQAGITGFISTWWGQHDYHDRAFATLINRAEKKNFHVTIYWETAPGSGRQQIDRAIDDMSYVLKTYAHREGFLKLDGKPVIFVYGRVMDQVPMSAWPDIVRGIRAKAGDVVLLADGYQSSYARLFDGIHTYNIASEVRDNPPAKLAKMAATAFAGDVALARSARHISCLTIIPGYDDTKIRHPGLQALRFNGDTYRTLWRQAIAANPDWILITSFNEWHEGSEIEPSVEYGDLYLKITREFAPKFLAMPPVKAVAGDQSNVSSRQMAQLKALYAGKTVGILPDLGGRAPFFLLDAGITIRELAWKDLVDPQVMDVAKMPVLLHAGTENYVSRINAAGDVEKALRRYLSAGGTLVAIPTLPIPFYYDQSNDRQPAGIAAHLGLPIAIHWEAPPDGLKLSFVRRGNTLEDVPATVPYPTSGDLRWRGASRQAAPAGSTYVPLVSLVDQDGKNHGDAVTLTRLSGGGQAIYACMRAPELLGHDAFLLDIFQLAAKEGFARRPQ